MNTQRRPKHKQSRRGHALVASLVIVVILAVLAVTFTSLGAVNQYGYLYTGQSTESFYAAEGGVEVSIKELVDNSDVDSNSTIGSMSSKAIGNAAVYTTYSGGTLLSYGSAGGGGRVIQVTISN